MPRAPKPPKVTRAEVAAAFGALGKGNKLSPKKNFKATAAIRDLYPGLTESAASSVGHHLHRAAKYDNTLTLTTLMENLEGALPKLEWRPPAGAEKGGACATPRVKQRAKENDDVEDEGGGCETPCAKPRAKKKTQAKDNGPPPDLGARHLTMTNALAA